MIYFFFLFFTILILIFALYEVQYFFVFEPKKYRREPLDERYTPLEIYAEDGTLLEGIIFTPQHFSHTILYFGGRSQDSVALIHKLTCNFENCQIVTFNYRGYGDSKGKATEKNLYSDAYFIAKKIEEHYGKFSVMGFSIGSSVAAFVASKIEVKNLFLIGAFESVFSLFRAKAPLLPSFLIRYRFDTALHVSVVEAKSYLLSSKDDEIVPIENFYNLKKRIKNLVEYKELTSYNHDEILFSQETQDLVKRVLH